MAEQIRGLIWALLSIGFLGLISSMMIFMCVQVEKKFYQRVRDLMLMWQDERRQLRIGTEEYKSRMETMERLLPDTKALSRIISASMASVVAGIIVYSWSFLAMHKGWKPPHTLLKLLIFSAFCFLLSGGLSYYAGQRLSRSTRRIVAYLERIYGTKGN